MTTTEIQGAISVHQPANWEDFEEFLPDWAPPLPPAGDAEARERRRLALLRAIREGNVAHLVVEDLTRDDEGEPNDDHAGRGVGAVAVRVYRLDL